MGSGDTRNVILVAVGSGLLITGVLALGVAAFGSALGVPFGPGLAVSALVGLVVVFLRWQEIVRGELDLWRAKLDVAAAQRRAEAARYHFEAAAYSLSGTGDDDVLDDDRLSVRASGSAYSLPRLTPEEQALMAEVGECLRFLAIGKRAHGYSVRLMAPYRPANMTRAQFESWWTARTDRLAGWGLFEKSERRAARPAGNRSLDDVRRALLQREFPTGAVGAPVTETDRQEADR